MDSFSTLNNATTISELCKVLSLDLGIIGLENGSAARVRRQIYFFVGKLESLLEQSASIGDISDIRGIEFAYGTLDSLLRLYDFNKLQACHDPTNEEWNQFISRIIQAVTQAREDTRVLFYSIFDLQPAEWQESYTWISGVLPRP